MPGYLSYSSSSHSSSSSSASIIWHSGQILLYIATHPFGFLHTVLVVTSHQWAMMPTTDLIAWGRSYSNLKHGHSRMLYSSPNAPWCVSYLLPSTGTPVLNFEQECSLLSRAFMHDQHKVSVFRLLKKILALMASTSDLVNLVALMTLFVLLSPNLFIL